MLFECCNSCAGCRSYSPTAVSCPAGSFCPSGSPTPVLCGVGQYSDGGASVCSACPGGVYGNTTGLSNAACSGLCSAGFMCPAGSTTPETHLCPSGRYSLPGAATCSNCRQEAVLLYPVIPVLCCGVVWCVGGLSVTPFSASSCCRAVPSVHNFSAGFYGDSPGQLLASCSGLCGAGYVCPSGTVVPVECPPGERCPPASSAGVPCSAGTYRYLDHSSGSLLSVDIP